MVATAALELWPNEKGEAPTDDANDQAGSPSDD